MEKKSQVVIAQGLIISCYVILECQYYNYNKLDFLLNTNNEITLSNPKKLDIRSIESKNFQLITNKISILKKNDSFISKSIYDIQEVSNISKSVEEESQSKNSGSSIFVEAFQNMYGYTKLKRIANFDPVYGKNIPRDILVQAHHEAMEMIDKQLPRKITRKDKSVKFGNNYRALFLVNYETLFNLKEKRDSESNLPKSPSKTQIKRAESRLYKKYNKASKDYLRMLLFEDRYALKFENCTYVNCKNLVNVYFSILGNNTFAAVDSKTNTLVVFGNGSLTTYAELFLNNSLKSINPDLLTIPAERPERPEVESLIKDEPTELEQISKERAKQILMDKYGTNFVLVKDGLDEFKIEDSQAAKKIKHAVCFGIKVEPYDYTQKLAEQMDNGGILAYIMRGNPLPSLDLVRSYQMAIKEFCENRELSERNDFSTFYGEPSITFYNSTTLTVAIFDRETKIFKSAYKITKAQSFTYEESGIIGEKKNDSIKSEL